MCTKPLSPNIPAPATIVQYRPYFDISGDQNLQVDASAVALDAAYSGYSSTSLDEICAVIGMNRPNQTLYLKALERYWQLSLVAMREALAHGEQTFGAAMMRAYEG